MKKILGIQKYINKITLSYVMVGIYYIVSVYAMLYCRLKVVHNLLVLRWRIMLKVTQRRDEAQQEMRI